MSYQTDVNMGREAGLACLCGTLFPAPVLSPLGHIFRDGGELVPRYK